MKFTKNSLTTSKTHRVLILLLLLSFTNFIEANTKIKNGINVLNRTKYISKKSQSKKYPKQASKVNLNTEEQRAKEEVSFISLSSKRARSHKVSKTGETGTSRKSKLLSMMRRRTKTRILEDILFFFNSFKDDSNGKGIIMNFLDKSTLIAENFIIKKIWQWVISKVGEIDTIVEKIKFIANNPITALLLYIKDQLTSDSQEVKEEIKQIEKKIEYVFVQRGPDRPNQKLSLHIPKKDLVKTKESSFWQNGKRFVVQNIGEGALNQIRSFINDRFDEVYMGFFKGMIQEFSPISLINTQDSQTLGNIQDFVTQSVSGNKVSDSESALTSSVNGFINIVVTKCRYVSDLQEVSKKFISTLVNVFSKHFDFFKNIIESVNDLLQEGNESEVEKKTETDKPKELKEISIWTKIKNLITDIWELIKAQIEHFFLSMKGCLDIYEREFANFVLDETLRVGLSIVGGILDGFLKQIPAVPQIIGMINSIVSIYQFLRIFTFGKPEEEESWKKQLNDDNLGVKLAKFVASMVRGALGLLNIPGLENILKVAYHVYILGMRLFEDKDTKRNMELKKISLDTSKIDNIKKRPRKPIFEKKQTGQEMVPFPRAVYFKNDAPNQSGYNFYRKP